MALRMRKDIKKSSYYVWFLGAKESKGIRGKEFIIPVIEHLVEREKEVEPFKVTLQVSHKGLKIIQNVLSSSLKNSKPKTEIIKHFIPHNTITCVLQDEDIVSCILLLYNPVTKCPLHVHVYRCDSVETATLLKNQLEVLIDRPENQKKYSDLENRFGKPKKNSSIGSDTGTSTRESESSEERFYSGERMASLYDSLAAELRQKLGKTESPILLPPRDYDTVHRQKGNLQGIDLRRCLNTNIVGQNAKKRIESSGGSSGIGSDHAPSPDSPESPLNLMDNQSTSDEEWNAEQSDSTLYLMHGDMILPRASRHPDSTKFSPEPPKSPTRFHRYVEDSSKSPKYLQRYSEHDDQKFSSYPEYRKYQENGSKHRSSRYHEDFEETPPRFYPDEEDRNCKPTYEEYPVKKSYTYYQNEEKIRPVYSKEDRFYQEEDHRYFYQDSKTLEKKKHSRSKYPEEYFEEDCRKRPEDRQRSQTPPEHNVSPKDRFKDAKEKFLLLERERLEEQERLRRQELHSSTTIKDKTFLKRHDSIVYPKERYQEERRYEIEGRYQPKPAPRMVQEEDVRYRRDLPINRYRSPERYEKSRRSMYNQIEDDHKIKSNEIAKELKRRSYLETSNYEKDYYRDNYADLTENKRYTKPNLESDCQNELKYSKNQKIKPAAGYRHSYAEPKLTAEKIGKKSYPEMVHRTNSSVSNSGRVGLASVNPY